MFVKTLSVAKAEAVLFKKQTKTNLLPYVFLCAFVTQPMIHQALKERQFCN